MRILKFRAWDKGKKRMFLIGEEPYYDGEYQDFNFKVDFQEPDGDKENDLRWCVDSNNWEIMQFTGLKDKNGKEIYEGDIIRDGEYGNKFDGGLGVVEFVIKNSCGYPIAGYFYRVSCDEAGVIFQDQVEVIGNIYENPDLLA